MAPECILSADEHTSASDVWSFGVLMYEIAVNGKNSPLSENDIHHECSKFYISPLVHLFDK